MSESIPAALREPTPEALPPSVWCVLAWILVVVLTPVTATRWLVAETLILSFGFGLFGMDPRRIALRWRSVAFTVAFLAAFVTIGHPRRTEIGWPTLFAGLLLKNGLLFGTVAAISDSVGPIRMLAILARLGMPAELVSTMAMMARYGPLLHDQVRRMKRARQSRMVRRSLPGIWLFQSGGLAALLSGSLRRSHRIHAAMLARGWQSKDASPDSG